MPWNFASLNLFIFFLILIGSSFAFSKIVTLSFHYWKFHDFCRWNKLFFRNLKSCFLEKKIGRALSERGTSEQFGAGGIEFVFKYCSVIWCSLQQKKPKMDRFGQLFDIQGKKNQESNSEPCNSSSYLCCASVRAPAKPGPSIAAERGQFMGHAPRSESSNTSFWLAHSRGALWKKNRYKQFTSVLDYYAQ